MLVCLGVGGLRAGEVCRLNVEDVEIRPHEVLLTVNGKGRKQRVVDLPGSWVGLFRGYLRTQPKSSNISRYAASISSSRSCTVPEIAPHFKGKDGIEGDRFTRSTLPL